MEEIHVKKKERSSWVWILAALAIVALVIWLIARNTGSDEDGRVNRTDIPAPKAWQAHHTADPLTVWPIT
jgi:hypothetical protein